MRWVAGGITVAALAVLALIAVNSGSAPPRMPPTRQIAGRPAPTAGPAGTRPVTFHGLTVFVPASWATDAVKCGAPLRNTVFFGDGAQSACGSIGTSPFSMATFTSWAPGHTDSHLRQQSLTIDGHRAMLGTNVADGTYVSELIIADLSARVTIASVSARINSRIVRSAQITRTDANGCASTMPYVDLTSPPTTGPPDVMVAGRPSAVVVCHYMSRYLERGVRLSSAAAARLVAALNALPSGLSEVSRSTYLPSLCRGGKLARQGDASDEEDFAIRLSYPGRPTSVVYGRLGLCGAVGFTNGARTGQRTEPVIDQLNALFDDQLIWPGPVLPR